MPSEIDEILGPEEKDGEGEGDETNELELISQELIEAVHARNTKDVAQALRAAFACLESYEHEEGPQE